MSVAGPCSILRGGGMRGLSSSFSHRDQSQQQLQQQLQQHQQQALPNMANRFGAAIAAPAPASSTATWNDNDQPLPDIMSAPTLRSVSSLVMSMDADESVSPTAAASSSAVSGGFHNTSNGIPRSSRAAAKDVAVSSAMTSTMVDDFLTPLPPPPAPMNSNNHLTREQSFPPTPFFAQQPRFARDQSFPPPAQQSAGLAGIDMLPSTSSSLRNNSGWPSVPHRMATTESPCSGDSGGGGMMEDSSGIFGDGGGEPSMPKFRGLGFPGSSSSSSASLQMKGWGPDTGGGGRGHLGGGTGGCSTLGEEDPHNPLFDGILSPSPSSACHPRRPSFDKLAAMIPDIPHWPTPSSSTSAPLSPSSRVPVEGAGELRISTMAETADQLPAPTSTARPTLSPPSSSSVAAVQPMPPSSRGRQPITTPRSDKRPKKEPLRRGGADSSAGRLPRDGSGNHNGSRWTATPSPAANPTGSGIIKKTPSSGTGKRGTEAPLSCGPARAGGGPIDLAKQERRRVKIQRYLYKRSRRKFAKSTRDASPSRSRPKAAAKRPRVKGKFVKTTPEYVSVSSGQQERGGAGEAEVTSNKEAVPSCSPAVGAVALPGGGGGVGGGGVRSVRNGGSVNTNFNKKAFSTTPSSSLMPRGGGAGGGGGRLPPPVSALATGAPNAFSSWTM